MAVNRRETEVAPELPKAFLSWLLLGIALCAPTYGLYLSHTGFVPASIGPYFQVSCVAAFLPPLLLTSIQVPTKNLFCLQTILLIISFLFPLIFSIFLNIKDYDYLSMMTALTRIVAITLYMTTMAVILQHPRCEELLARGYGTMALLLAALFIFSATTAPVWHWGRFKPGDLHPNWWGEVFVALTFGASFIRLSFLRYALWVLALVGLALVQSRGSLLFSLIIMAFASFEFHEPKRLLRVGLFGLFVVLPCLLTIDALWASKPMLLSVYEYVMYDVLETDHPTRGLGSGLSGRDENWADGFALFVQSPLLGAGFSRSDLIMTEETDAPIHNGLLTIVSDVGLPMSLVLFVLMFGALWRSLRARRWREGGYLLAFLCVYMMISPRSINVSVLPMLLWMLVMRSWILPSRKEPVIVCELPTAERPRLLARRWIG